MLRAHGGRDESSTRHLLELCSGYFVLYAITGIAVKYYQGGPPAMSGMTFLAYSLIGGSAVNLILITALGWWRLASNGTRDVLGFTVPREILYIVPSGIMTAVVVPTTTLMYSLPISVMVAMTIMRGSVIVISRAVDWIQTRQGILTRPVVWEENAAIGFALAAVGLHVFFAGDDGFDFVGSVAAVAILTSYIVAYAVRIYLMNYFKNTRAKGVKQDNKGFFAVEQLSASATMLLVGLVLVVGLPLLGVQAGQIDDFRAAFSFDVDGWFGALVFGGAAFGGVAVFSVFIFMFRGRTATFAGLVNRLTSLNAGIAATLAYAAFFGGSWPTGRDWIALGLILCAVALLARAELRRKHEEAEDAEAARTES